MINVHLQLSSDGDYIITCCFSREIEYCIIDIYLLLLNMGLCDLESCCITNTTTVLSSLTFQKMLGHRSIIFLNNIMINKKSCNDTMKKKQMTCSVKLKVLTVQNTFHNFLTFNTIFSLKLLEVGEQLTERVRVSLLRREFKKNFQLLV